MLQRDRRAETLLYQGDGFALQTGGRCTKQLFRDEQEVEYMLWGAVF